MDADATVQFVLRLSSFFALIVFNCCHGISGEKGSTTPKPPEKENDKQFILIIAGSAIGGVFVVVCITVICWILCRRNSDNKDNTEPTTMAPSDYEGKPRATFEHPPEPKVTTTPTAYGTGGGSAAGGRGAAVTKVPSAMMSGMGMPSGVVGKTTRPTTTTTFNVKTMQQTQTKKFDVKTMTTPSTLTTTTTTMKTTFDPLTKMPQSLHSDFRPPTAESKRRGGGAESKSDFKSTLPSRSDSAAW